MSRFEECVKKMVQTLELQIMPIGVRFSERPDRRGVERGLRICEAIDAVRRENAVFNLSKETCFCRGGSHIAGWQCLSLEEFAAIFHAAGVYASKKVAEASVGKQPKPVSEADFLFWVLLTSSKRIPTWLFF